MISQHHGLLVDEINASKITNTTKCMNASSFNILLQGCSCTRYYIIGLANLIYQICKDNKANKHGEKNLQKPQFYFHLNSLWT
jgi:hypothetical protein